MASILVVVGKQEGDFWPLGRRTTIVGRDEALLAQILDDLVSRKHMKIRFDEDSGKYYASDMNSRNGVFINNEKIAEERALVEGDVLSIGGTALLFTQQDFDDRESALSKNLRANAAASDSRAGVEVGTDVRVTKDIRDARTTASRRPQSHSGHPLERASRASSLLGTYDIPVSYWDWR